MQVCGIKWGIIGFCSAPSRMAIRGALEGEIEDVQQDVGCDEANVEVVPDVGQALKRSITCVANFAAGK
jgi:hypothetical protein